jgi:hypothetical protein
MALSIAKQDRDRIKRAREMARLRQLARGNLTDNEAVRLKIAILNCIRSDQKSPPTMAEIDEAIRLFDVWRGMTWKA